MTNKRWRVTFEVDQWAGTEWEPEYRFNTLELKDFWITIPNNAVIEDITPLPPLEDGFYMHAKFTNVYRRRNSVWEVRKIIGSTTEWVFSDIIDDSNENESREYFTYLGPLT